MTIQEHINYWIAIADNDLPVAETLFKKKYFVWSLYICHLILEKIIKAHYVKDNQETPPKIHDLLKLSERINIEFDSDTIRFFKVMNRFCIEARYPEYKQDLEKLCTYKYSKEQFNKTKEIFTWLKSLLIS